jgi:hypothetical protein
MENAKLAGGRHVDSGSSAVATKTETGPRGWSRKRPETRGLFQTYSSFFVFFAVNYFVFLTL